MTTEAPLHAVIGAGQIGPALARHLVAQGVRVRLVRHSSTGTGDGFDVVHGDLSDRASLQAATAGASVIYHCANPPYFAKDWAQHLPRWTDNLVAAAGTAGARLVVMDNVYAFGDLRGRPLTEDAPFNPCSRKGEVRAAVARQLDAAHTAGHARVVVGRASDFWGPYGTLTYFGDQFWPDVFKGKPARTLGNTSTPHTYHYIPDVVAGLAQLGLATDDVTGRWWMLPCQPPVSTLDMIARLGAAAGLSIRTAPVPPLMQRVLGLFIKALPELREMTYQWEGPFVMDDARFRAKFPEVRPTPIDTAAAATVAWARAKYAGA